MKIIAIIPARGGSKSIPRKNLKLLNGKPLISYIIETAKQIDLINRVIVSSEDEEIRNVAKKYGAEVPFIRPKELAQDDTPTLPVLRHCIEYLESKENYVPDVIVLLYPTAPLLKKSSIIGAIKSLISNHYDSLFSGMEDRKHYWHQVNGELQRFYPQEVVNRQLSIPLLKEDGCLYIATRDLIMEKREILGGKVGVHVLSEQEKTDIDYQSDFDYVEYLLKNRLAY